MVFCVISFIACTLYGECCSARVTLAVWKIFGKVEFFLVYFKVCWAMYSFLVSLKLSVVVLLIFLRHNWHSFVLQRLTGIVIVMSGGSAGTALFPTFRAEKAQDLSILLMMK